MTLVITHANDLQRLAQKHGWEAGPLTYARVSRMGSQELNFHEIFNKAELEKALDEPHVTAESKRNAETAQTAQYWKKSGEATEETVNEVKKFCARHPQFRGDIMGNRTALIEHLKASNLPVTQDTLTEAFQMLGREGKLVLSPSKVGVVRVRLSSGQIVPIRKEDLRTHKSSGKLLYGRDSNVEQVLDDDDSVTGAQLSRHPLLDVLLSPYSADVQHQRDFDRQSAEDYRRQNPQAFVQQTPALVEQTQRQAVASFLSFHPELKLSSESAESLRTYMKGKGLAFTLNNLETAYAALAEAGEIESDPEAVVSSRGTKIVDYGYGVEQRNRGPELPSKESLAYKVRSMDANTYAEWIANPTNRRAIDNQLAAMLK